MLGPWPWMLVAYPRHEADGTVVVVNHSRGAFVARSDLRPIATPGHRGYRATR